MFVRPLPSFVTFSGTKLDADARNGIKEALVLLQEEEEKLAKAREAGEIVSHAVHLRRILVPFHFGRFSESLRCEVRRDKSTRDGGTIIPFQ